MNLPEGVTPEMVAQWKKEHDKVGALNLPKGKVAIVHRPSRNTVGEFEKQQDSSPNGARTVLIENCVLWGKEDVLADDEMFFSCARGLIDLIPISKAEFEAF